ncbi:acidic mammalian chitinase [Nematostella vectensis]|uniref:acidic mammalian chitinase n=1 Tax=Nematostella vectensis TaxID=45351 RepID=UPI00138FEB80|nr:acidic mammalian chitinase [Nematostella vectensis]
MRLALVVFLSFLLAGMLTTIAAAGFCADQEDGLYKDPDTCYGFINCAGGRTYKQACGPGTMFNPSTKVCDWPHNVDCEEGSGEF